MAAVGQGNVCIFDTALTANDSTAKEMLSAIRTEHDGTNGLKMYMYVYASTAVANGTPVVITGTNGYTVGTDSTTIGLKPCVGVGVGDKTTDGEGVG